MPYPSVSEDVDVHALVVGHKDKESHERLFPQCNCLDDFYYDINGDLTYYDVEEYDRDKR